MTRQQLERHQVWVYLGGIVAGLTTGTLAPAVSSQAEILLWPVLGVLLYATFTQVPLTHLSDAFRDVRFTGAVLAGNFVIVPVVVAILLPLVPAEPAVRLGVLLVLLVPCTDWFITFTYLGGGDTRRALAVTPVNLLVQFGLLPILLWLFLGRTFVEILAVDRIAQVFITLIVIPLVAAYLTERAVERRPSRAAIVDLLGWLPVPLLGTVVFIIAASQMQVVADSLPVLGRVTAVFAVYLIAVAAIGVGIAWAVSLPTRAARTLVFSLGTRNSFVVLPFALALPDSWSIAVVVIVLQSLVELWGMVAYLWLVPKVLLRMDRGRERTSAADLVTKVRLSTRRFEAELRDRLTRGIASPNLYVGTCGHMTPAGGRPATQRAEFRFYAELNDFLPREKRFRTFVREFEQSSSIKDMIEAEGVPHTEVDLVIANGESVGFEWHARDGDRIAVYPVFETFDLTQVTRLRPEPLREPRFALDAHLGTLARRLRLLGFDTLYHREWDDADLARRAGAERRILLTRDVGLLKRRVVTHGYFVRERDPRAQAVEVARRLQLLTRFRPFTRCLACNGELVAISKEDVAAVVPERTSLCHDEFVTCNGCRKVYWRGSHHARLAALVAGIRAELSSS